MHESINRKSATASTVKDAKRGVPRGVRCGALCAVLAFANLPAIPTAQSSCPGIHVKILNIRNSTGTVACALFESPEGFPHEFLRSATNVMVIKVRKAQARCDFEDVQPGTYAMAVIHDENMNGKLDTNLLGIPTEGYGFSNDAKGLIGAPSLSAASFLDCWRRHHAAGAEEPDRSRGEMPERLLVRRGTAGIEMQRIGRLDYLCLQSLAAGGTLLQVAEAALAASTGFDLGAVLSRWASAGVISDVEIAVTPAN